MIFCAVAAERCAKPVWRTHASERTSKGQKRRTKLDRLTEKYRSKFSQRSSDKSTDATSSGQK